MYYRLLFIFFLFIFFFFRDSKNILGLFTFYYFSNFLGWIILDYEKNSEDFTKFMEIL